MQGAAFKISTLDSQKMLKTDDHSSREQTGPGEVEPALLVALGQGRPLLWARQGSSGPQRAADQVGSILRVLQLEAGAAGQQPCSGAGRTSFPGTCRGTTLQVRDSTEVVYKGEKI